MGLLQYNIQPCSCSSNNLLCEVQPSEISFFDLSWSSSLAASFHLDSWFLHFYLTVIRHTHHMSSLSAVFSLVHFIHLFLLDVNHFLSFILLCHSYRLTYICPFSFFLLASHVCCIQWLRVNIVQCVYNCYTI